MEALLQWLIKSLAIQSVFEEIILHHTRDQDFVMYQLKTKTKENWYCCLFTYWIGYIFMREVVLVKGHFKIHDALYKPFKIKPSHVCSI